MNISFKAGISWCMENMAFCSNNKVRFTKVHLKGGMGQLRELVMTASWFGVLSLNSQQRKQVMCS